MTLSLSPARITCFLAAAAGGLVLAGLGSVVSKHVLGHDHAFGLVRLFDLDREGNVPAWFSSCALLLCSALLAAAARVARLDGAPFARHWAWLAVIFLAMSIDEAASIHELLIRPLRGVLPSWGVLHFGWVVPGAVFVAAVGLAYWRFIWRLSPSTRRLFVLAGALYVGGALGLELLGGWLVTTHGWTLAEALEAVGEAALEMAGLVVFIHALMDLLARVTGEITIRLGAPR